MSTVPVRSSLRTSKFAVRPITTSKLGKTATHRKSLTPALAPLGVGQNNSAARPQTRSSLEVKKWRQSLFPSTAPASRREVELLGEWLNSVLAENLEQHDNPLDVCTNAQHWFSVAFNELVRQVSVDCAERGRLYAVIWKRNQDLLSKLVQVQREERQYILSCHKERMQFLKTDLEFCQSRLSTVSSAYNEEQQRWINSHERDVSKFDNLQAKIDEQVESRKKLMSEIKELKTQLGMKVEEDEAEETGDRSFSYTYDDLAARAQEMRWDMINSKCELLDMANEMDNITHFLDRKQTEATEIRDRFERYFLTLPSDARPAKRPAQWLLATISFIYSYYLTALASVTADHDISNKPFAEVVYEMLLGIYGTRAETEKVLYDLLYTVKMSTDISSTRVISFARFFGLWDPLPLHVCHFYLHALTTMNRAHSGPLFPEVEAGEKMLSGIPAPAAVSASSKVFERFTSGRTLKFYNERVNKIAGDGMMRFGGKNIAELDQVLDYIVSAYTEECEKLEDIVKEHFSKLPDGEIRTFSQFNTIMNCLKHKPKPESLPAMMREALAKSQTGGIGLDLYREIVDKSCLNLPFILEPGDFLSEQNGDDVTKFMILEVQEHIEMYESLLKRLEEVGDELLMKQLKSAKAKFDQALASRSLGRTFQTIQREFYEKMFLAKLFVEKK